MDAIGRRLISHASAPFQVRSNHVGERMKLSPEPSGEVQRDAPQPVLQRASEVGAGTHESGIYPCGSRPEELTSRPSIPSAEDTFVRASAKKPHLRIPAGAHPRAWSVLVALVLHAVWHTPATSLLLALSPLFLLLGNDGSGKWAMRAAGVWLLLAVAERVYPTASTGSEAQQLVSIAVLAVVLWRLHRVRSVLHDLVRRDPLTALLNRRGFDETATRELLRASRYARPLAFALIDIDRFKQVNDVFGHGFGDRVLQTVAEELGDLRGSDLAVRLGGDEFGVLMPETDEAGAELMLKRVQQRVKERTGERGWPVTLSVGIVGLETLGRAPSVGAVIAEADRRMYRMKSGWPAASSDAEAVRAGQRG